MGVETRALLRRDGWGMIILRNRSIRSQLRAMAMAVITVGMRMNLGHRNTTHDHRHQQQQAGQLPTGTLDPKGYPATDGLEGHA